MSARRNWRGRFIKNLRESPEDSRVWLIWSHYHGLWHRRDAATGGACGYTADLADAGLFPRSMAMSYHDGDRNEPFHVSEKGGALQQAIETAQRRLEQLQTIARAA